MIVGTGIDIIQIERIRRIKNRWGSKFLDRVYTPQEIKYCQKKVNSEVHLAARFAAKEAAAKMLGTGFKKIRWKDIEIKNDVSGKPHLKMGGRADRIAQKKQIDKVHLSISHEKKFAVAQVIGEVSC